MTTEQNYYIAFHSVIAVDMEKERKKKRTFQNVCRENQMFSLSRVCHGAHLQTQQQQKNFLGGRGGRKRKTRLGQHPVAACPPEPGNNLHHKKKRKIPHAASSSSHYAHYSLGLSAVSFFLFSIFLFRERTNELEKVAEKIDRETFSFSIPKNEKSQKNNNQGGRIEIESIAAHNIQG
jgi:hypothetical protein